jgi:hypothetical protein
MSETMNLCKGKPKHFDVRMTVNFLYLRFEGQHNVNLVVNNGYLTSQGIKVRYMARMNENLCP